MLLTAWRKTSILVAFEADVGLALCRAVFLAAKEGRIDADSGTPVLSQLLMFAQVLLAFRFFDGRRWDRRAHY